MLFLIFFSRDDDGVKNIARGQDSCNGDLIILIEIEFKATVELGFQFSQAVIQSLVRVSIVVASLLDKNLTSNMTTSNKGFMLV